MLALVCLLAASAPAQWSEPIGTLGGAQITAIETTGQGLTMRGLRIDLPEVGTPLFVSVSEATALKRILLQLQKDVDRLRLAEQIAGNIGSCEFRERPGELPFTVDYSGGWEPGLRIHSRRTIKLSGTLPRELAELLGNGITRLTRRE